MEKTNVSSEYILRSLVVLIIILRLVNLVQMKDPRRLLFSDLPVSTPLDQVVGNTSHCFLQKLLF